MIQLKKVKAHIFVGPSDEVGQSALDKPLHRIFMRGTIGAQPKAPGPNWEITIQDNTPEKLEKIVEHFKRYKITYRLDSGCQCFLNDLEKPRVEYLAAIKNGLRVKRRGNPAEIIKIEKEIGKAFKRPLNKLQLRSVCHLLNVINGANFSVPGSGKTAIALAYYYLLKSSKVINTALIIGPLSCFLPWELEFKECFGRAPRVERLAGQQKKERKDIYKFPKKKDFFLLSYHTAARDLDLLLDFIRNDKFLVILDESHYIKKPQGGILADSILEIARFATRRLILTGTPMPNDLVDLWSQITFLWPKILPLENSNSYMRHLKDSGPNESLKYVKKKIEPLFFRITKKQLKLPKAEFKFIKIKLAPLQRRIYLGVASKFLSEVKEAPGDRESLRGWRRARAIRLLQIASNPTLLEKGCDEFIIPALDIEDQGLKSLIEHYSKYETPCKFASAVKLTKDLVSSGKKVVLWTSFIHNIKMLEKQLSQLNPTIIHGGIPTKTNDQAELDREARIERFKENKKCHVLIANPAACAESISLHMVCHDAIYLDRSFNCAHYLQSLDRIHRLGLDPNIKTTYYIFNAIRTIDHVVETRLQIKMKRMSEVIDGDFPVSFPGYWDNDLGAEEESDLEKVELHIKNLDDN